MKYGILCKTYKGSRAKTVERQDVFLGQDDSFFLKNKDIKIELDWEHETEGISGKISVSFQKDSTEPMAIGFQVTAEGWSRDNYVLAPGAAYDGNRMESIPYPYPPYHKVEQGDPAKAEPVITDIPHLDFHAPQSRLSFLSGDMSTPALGFYDREHAKGFFLMGSHQTGDSYTGFVVNENLEEQKASFELWAPGVRECTTYFFGECSDGAGFYPDNHAKSNDTGRYFHAGDKLELVFQMYYVPAKGITDFFRVFNTIRFCVEKETDREETVPFSAAYETIKEKYQKENFAEGPKKGEGYYTVGTNRAIPQQHWQAGWIGGGMNFLSFLLEDQGEAFERSVASFRFILDHLMYKNGWVCGIYADGNLYGDSFENKGDCELLLVRKNADLLYFLEKELLLLEKREKLRPGDREQVQKLADAFVRLYDKYGQIGQFIDTRRDEILMGNTASAAIAAAGLALAYEIFHKPEYLHTARELGELYYREYAARGILNGGPGEICQAPDSEAAFGLLESYVQLYETTGEHKWLVYAEDTFEIAVTWVMSYDFHFPEGCTAAKRGAHTRGSVFANAQNKHSAPGICTLSGNSMLKLYRYTGKDRYLDWLEQIAHSLPQFVSMKDNRVHTLDGRDLPPGYMNERVQTSDWEGDWTVGEFLYGSNWPEVSMLLTYVEVPGVYIDFQAKKVRCFDHIQCSSTFLGEQEVRLTLFNPTDYEAKVTVLLDAGREAHAVTQNYYPDMKKVTVKAGETVEVIIR